MALVYQVEMVLRLVGYSQEEIEGMGFDSIHRVLAFKNLIVGVLGEAVYSILEGITGPANNSQTYEVPQNPFDGSMDGSLDTPDLWG